MAKSDKIRVNKTKDPSIPKQCTATLIKQQFKYPKEFKGTNRIQGTLKILKDALCLPKQTRLDKYWQDQSRVEK